MKMVKSLLLGTAAGLVAMSGAQAADLPVKAKPVQYVKICDLYGAGYFYVPGTDTCMKLGAGHPMGPLALLDFVGLDVSRAIGDALYAESNEPNHKPPDLMVKMEGEGKLGRKSGAGFYSYD